MLPIYWICFIFGGIFVLLAAIGGIDGVDVEQADIGDAGLDAELDAELDSNFDGDAASNLDLDIDQAPPSLADTDLEWSTIPRRLRAIWQILRSFKFWTFGLCFFGLTGLVLSQLSVSAGLALASVAAWQRHCAFFTIGNGIASCRCRMCWVGLEMLRFPLIPAVGDGSALK
jgi:hypothetical protein